MKVFWYGGAERRSGKGCGLKRPAFCKSRQCVYLRTEVLQIEEVGADDGEGTPVPIPNTAVKLTGADNTWLEAARDDK